MTLLNKAKRVILSMQGEFKKGDIQAEGSKTVVTKALAELVASGEIERISVGVYRVTGASASTNTTKPAKAKVSKKVSAETCEEECNDEDDSEEEEEEEKAPKQKKKKKKLKIKKADVAATETYKVVVNGAVLGEWSMDLEAVKAMVSSINPNVEFNRVAGNEVHYLQKTSDKN